MDYDDIKDRLSDAADDGIDKAYKTLQMLTDPDMRDLVDEFGDYVPDGKRGEFTVAMLQGDYDEAADLADADEQELEEYMDRAKELGERYGLRSDD